MLSEVQTFILNFAISGSASIISKTALAPVERAKLILQNQMCAYQIITGQRKEYKGLIDVFRRVPKEQGIISLWRGNGVNLLRYFPSQALNFAFYDVFTQGLYSVIKRDSYEKEVFCKFTAGGMAGAITTALLFPLLFCQTRLSVDIGADGRKSKIPREFRGLNNCIAIIVKKDGIAGLYRGIMIGTLGIALYRAFYFALFDVTKQLYRKAPKGVDNTTKPPLVMLFIMAQFVTTTAGLLFYPLDTISRYMMLDSGRPAAMRKCKTVTVTTKHIYKTRGLYGFYMGGLTNVIRCTAGAVVLVLYDEFLYYTNWKEKIKRSNFYSFFVFKIRLKCIYDIFVITPTIKVLVALDIINVTFYYNSIMIR